MASNRGEPFHVLHIKIFIAFICPTQLGVEFSILSSRMSQTVLAEMWIEIQKRIFKKHGLYKAKNVTGRFLFCLSDT